MWKKKKEEVEDIKDIDATDGASKEEEKTEEVEAELVDKPKEKKRFKLFQTFNVYKFIIKIVATILLITLGILILVNDDMAVFALFIIAGGVTGFQALIRSFFLLKKSRNKKAKIVTLVELLIEFALAVFFIIAAVCARSVSAAQQAKENGEQAAKASSFAEGYAQFADDYYAIFISIIFYVASISYFWRTILYNEESDKFKFWMNFTLVTGGFVLLFANIIHAVKSDDHTPLTASTIAIIIAVLAFVSAVVIGGEATGGYIQYRKSTKPIKEEKKEETDGIEAPAKDDKKDYNDIDPNAIPHEEPNTDTDIIS